MSLETKIKEYVFVMVHFVSQVRDSVGIKTLYLQFGSCCCSIDVYISLFLGVRNREEKLSVLTL